MSESPLHVLLVEDNPGDARLLEESLTEDAGDAFRLEWAKDLNAALEKVAGDFVDAVLLDLNLPDSAGFESFLRMRAAAPEIPIVVLTGLEDDQVGLKTIQQGAQDYLSKSELTGAAVARALRYAVERHRNRAREVRSLSQRPNGQVIGFLGAKGGVGTTTVTLSVASLIAKNRRSVCAAELHPAFGAFAVYLQESPAHSLGTLLRLDLQTVAEGVIEKCLVRSRFGFDVLFSPQRPEEFHPLPAETLPKLIRRLAHRSAFTLLDLPQGRTAETEAALACCQFCVLVVERDPASLASAAVALRYLATRSGRMPPLGIVVVNRSLMLDSASARQIESALECDVLGVVPPAPEVAISAQKAGAPLALHRPLSAPASMLNAITGKILGRLAEKGPPAAALALPAGR